MGRRTLLGMSVTYPSDLTDAEWACGQRCLPRLPRGGAPCTHPLRTILDAIFYVVRIGCASALSARQLPTLANGVLPFQTVSYVTEALGRNVQGHTLAC